jgi:hypothetical protein
MLSIKVYNDGAWPIGLYSKRRRVMGWSQKLKTTRNKRRKNESFFGSLKITFTTTYFYIDYDLLLPLKNTIYTCKLYNYIPITNPIDFSFIFCQFPLDFPSNGPYSYIYTHILYITILSQFYTYLSYI